MIRHATLDDVPAITAMGGQLIQSEYREILRENPAQMADVAIRLIESESGAVLVDEVNDAVVGMIGMFSTPHLLTGEIVAGELFWWVDPLHRGRGLRLLKQAEQWAHAKGATRIQMVAPNDRVGQLYARMGYLRMETSYQKDIVP